MHQLIQVRNSKDDEYLIVIDKTWSMEEVRDYFFRQGIDLTGFRYRKHIDLYDFDLEVRPGDWWKNVKPK